MNVLASECSSGCESGWTLYLDHSFLSQNPPNTAAFVQDHMVGGFADPERRTHLHNNEEEEEEDMSMVSDASSGPPHFREDDDCSNDDNGCFYPAFSPAAAALARNNLEMQKLSERRRQNRRRAPPPQDCSHLDDTASSPACNFYKTNVGLSHQNSEASRGSILEYSHGFSATHFEGRSAFQNHFGFFQQPLAGTQLQQNQ